MGMFGEVKESGQGVPPGIYTGTLEKVEPVPASVKDGVELKPAFMFSFKVLDGEHAGSMTSRIPSGERPTTKNGLGKFLSELTGIPLAPGVRYDDEISKCHGQKYTLVVKTTKTGATRVDTVMPIK
jgi:hypothetical protein